jgi:hypothetical protein
MKKHLLILFFCLTFTGGVFAQSGESKLMALAGSSIDGQPDGATVVFYPNPVKRMLNVRFPDKGTHTVSIYNIVGDKIAEKTVLDDYLVELDLGDLTRGMFFLSYEQGGKVVTKTFSKN